MNNDRKILSDILLSVCKTPEAMADRLISRYGDILRITESNIDELASTLNSESMAIYLKLSVFLASRCVTDNFKFGKKHTKIEIEEYLRALFLGKSVETVYALSFDADGRVIACDFLGDGTVNQSAILPRKLLEISMKRGACGVILAHNHPGGYPMPSNADRSNTASLYTVLISSGIKLISHYTFAGSEFGIIECEYEN